MMKITKNIIYVTSFLILIVRIFFKEYLTGYLDSITLTLAVILLLSIITIEFITRKK